MQQFMADLPAGRVNIANKPFTDVAIDYAGPFLIKLSNVRGCKMQKAYIAIFVCMATKAIHLEAVTDLTADAFIAAFRRFVARRGTVKNIFSDNGTNFVRANKILLENVDLAKNEFNEKICNELTNLKTTWHFSPPGGPHFNGLAEAAVKSVKSHIKKTIADAKLTYEEMATLLAQIEACVNSRPLCQLSSSPDDMRALTPAHFLVGQSLVAPPEQSRQEENINWLNRWQRVQKMTQHFWNRWSSEYLNQLQTRTKWFKRGEPGPKINDLVLIRDENLPPTQWQMARVLDTYPGQDELTRVVNLRTANNEMKRPITKICPLPIESNTEIKTNITRVVLKGPTFNLPLVITALLSICTLSHQAPIKNEPFEVTKFTSPSGLYFEKTHDIFMSHSTWNVISHLNLNKFNDEFKFIKTEFTTAKEACYRRAPRESGCRQLVDYMKFRISNLENKNAIIFGARRTKRSVHVPILHPIGDIFSDIFGTLGSEYANRMDGDVSSLFKNQENLMLLLQNNTSVINSTLDLVLNNGRELNNHVERINTITSIMKNQTNEMIIENNLHNFVTYLTQIIDEYERKQSAIIEVITDSGRKHINHELFTPTEVEKQIEIISKQMGSEYHVFRGSEVYMIGQISMYRLDMQYIFKISIPLLRQKSYNLYSISGIPTINNNEYLWIDGLSRYLLTSADRQVYQYMSNLESCRQYTDESTLICTKPTPWFTASKSSCAWNVFSHISHNGCNIIRKGPSVFFLSLDANQFIFVLNKPTRITVFCKNSITHSSLAGEGTLSLQPQCSLHTENVKLETRVIFGNKSELVIPKLDLRAWDDINLDPKWKVK